MKRALVVLLAMAGSAEAQEAPDTGVASAPRPASGASNGSVVTYDPAFFAQFTPQNAYDMVSRVPGFTIDEGSDRRGFAGAVGNVLIDGRRPSAKSQSLSSFLTRIPAGQVARIELIRDAANRSDAAGQSSLVNVVRTPSAGTGVYEATAEFTDAGRITPQVEASWTGRVDQLDYTVGASHYLEYRPLYGERTLLDGDRDLAGSRVDVTPRTYREDMLSGDVTAPLFGGTFRTNAQAGFWNFKTQLDSLGFDAAGARRDDFVLTIDEREQTQELGFNFDRTLGPGSIEVIGLATRRQYANDESTTLIDNAGDFGGAVAQSRRNDSGETILRGTYSWPAFENLRIDVGGEIAYNSLDANLLLTEDSGGGPVAIPLPSANVLVEEDRAEAFATFVWRPADKWSVEATLAGERSTLTQTGDTNLETELAYFKPSIQVTRQIGAQNQIRVRIYRDVDQLDFNDFVSAAGLADDIVVGGNPNLRPQTSWRAEIAGDWRYDNDGAIGLRLYNYWLKDAQDVVPVGPPGDQFDAPGNIGEGWVRGVELNATIPTGFVLANSRLTAAARLEDSEVTDPVTGEPRVISEWVGREIELNWRQDLNDLALAWGFYYYKESESITFRLNERDIYEEGPFLDLFVETTAIRGLKVRAFANNVFDSEFHRERSFFTPDRTGALAGVENRIRTFGLFYGITISGSL